MLLFCRRIIAEAERMARLNQQRKEEELAARMKRSTEGPAHHIVQVSSCLAIVVLWSLLVIGISFDDKTLMARLRLSVIMAIVVTSVCAISAVVATLFLLFSLFTMYYLQCSLLLHPSLFHTLARCEFAGIFVLMFCFCFVMWMCGFLILSLVSSQKIVELKKEEEENLYGTLFRAENSLNKQLYTSEQSTSLNILSLD